MKIADSKTFHPPGFASVFSPGLNVDNAPYCAANFLGFPALVSVFTALGKLLFAENSTWGLLKMTDLSIVE